MSAASREASGFAQQVLTQMIAVVPGGPTTPFAILQSLCGACASASVVNLDVPPNQIPASAFWSQMTGCFEQARTAGMTYENFTTVLTLIEGFQPLTWLGIAVANFCLRMTLAEQAQCLAALTFTSRAQVDNYLDSVTANFGSAVEIAADNVDTAVYVALLQMQAAVVNDLSTRAAPLPEIVVRQFARSLPALTISQLLYQNSTEVQALVDQNSIRHPLFCPLTMKVLSLGG